MRTVLNLQHNSYSIEIVEFLRDDSFSSFFNDISDKVYRTVVRLPQTTQYFPASESVFDAFMNIKTVPELAGQWGHVCRTAKAALA